MKARATSLLTCVLIVLMSSEVSAQIRDSERERLAQRIEQLVKAFGNPLERGKSEYLGVSIDPKTGDISQIYDDVDGRVRRGKWFKVNYLFNLRVVDPASIEVYNNLRWWSIRFNARKGEVIPAHTVIWSVDSQKNEDSWLAKDELEWFCGTETEGKAREIADYLRSLVKLYQ